MKSELIVKTKPKSVISEDIRTIRTNLDFSLSEFDKKVVMVTSSLPSEGKTFISSNLAVTLAENGNKVLLVDCDLRRGRLHRLFGVSNDLGLSNLISKFNKKDTDFKEYIQKTEVHKLSVLTRGAVPPNPSELLSSIRFSNIINDLKDTYDYVILDSAPVNGLPDALILSTLADKTVIVVKYESTTI